MIINFGIDITEHSRFKDKINDEKFIKRILSSDEINYYQTITNNDKQVEYLASRFSAKESLIKALQGREFDFSYSDISVLNNLDGSPYIKSNFVISGEILVSISHSKEYTITQVILKKNPV